MEQLKSIDVLNLAANSNNDLAVLLEKISSGNAILFTGAGFSSDSMNISDTEPPRAEALAKLIAKEGGFDGEGDLKFSANYFLRIKNEKLLVDLLKAQYTLKDVSQSHIDICAVDWRRIYTTNYDNSIELALRKNNKKGDCITLSEDPKVYYKKKNICLHINGNISSLKNDTIPESFKLSTASYLSADSFLSSNWIYSFKKDLEQASAIVFVGYSLYDVDIQKILFSSPHFKEKTFFITQADASKKSLFELSEFGTIFTVGIQGFAHELKNNMPIRIKSNAFWLESFDKYQLNHSTKEIQDKDILEFLLHGTIATEFINDAITGTQKLPYIIIRNKLEDAIKLLKISNFLTILSDFGNGKTVFLEELTSYLMVNGKNVYVLNNNNDGNVTEDIDKLAALNVEVYLIIDNYENCLEIIKYIAMLNDSNIKVVGSTRSSNQSHLYEELDIIQNSLELNIDILSEKEIEQFSHILENAALWADKAGLSDKKKIEIIQENNKSQISHTLLNLLNAPQMKDRIENILNNLFQKKGYKDTVFAICILEIMNQPLTFSNISEVSLSNSIYDANLTKNSHFAQLFPFRQSMILSKSALFARNLLKNHLSGLYTVDKLLDIAEKFHKLHKNGYFEATIYKSLLKFSFIERTLPTDGSKTNMLIRYYEQLKSRIGNLERTPHFWLQYAMARIAINDLPNAQNCLDTAYSKAYDDYDTSYLDAQQSRLWIQLAIKEQSQDMSMNHFEKAHRLLSNLKDDQYKYRQVEVYYDYYEAKQGLLSKANKNKFIGYVKEMISKLDGLHKGYLTETNRMDYCHQKLNDILVKYS